MSANDGAYVGATVKFTSGSATGYSYQVSRYDGSTRKLWLSQNFLESPTNASNVSIEFDFNDSHSFIKRAGYTPGATANANTNITTLNDYVNLLRMWRGTIASVDAVNRHLKQLQCSARLVHKRYQGIRVAYLIWQQPWMAAGSSCFISNVLEYMGLINVFSEKRTRVAVLQLLGPLNLFKLNFSLISNAIIILFVIFL